MNYDYNIFYVRDLMFYLHRTNTFEINDENLSLHSLSIWKHFTKNNEYICQLFGLIQLIDVRIQFFVQVGRYLAIFSFARCCIANMDE